MPDRTMTERRYEPDINFSMFFVVLLFFVGFLFCFVVVFWCVWSVCVCGGGGGGGVGVPLR